MIDRGNMIKANDDNPLVIINQILPIYVSFAVPERDLQEIKTCQRNGKLNVAALVPESRVEPPSGELTFIDNAVNVTTGTILLKATFPNTDKALWPGQFVKVVLTLATQQHAVVVPTQAVQIGQSGSYMFVVKNDRTVEMRSIVTGRTHRGETVVEQGVQAGEQVVTDGQLQLATGTNVEIKHTTTTQAPGR
jgi:multidrug efflux system membrane fusion protein